MNIKEFLAKNNYLPLLRMEDKKVYTLVFGKVNKEFERENEKGEVTPGLEIAVRDRADGVVKAWRTTSMSAIAQLAGLEAGDTFTLQRVVKKIPGMNFPIKVYEIGFPGTGKEDASFVDEEESPQGEVLEKEDIELDGEAAAKYADANEIDISSIDIEEK